MGSLQEKKYNNSTQPHTTELNPAEALASQQATPELLANKEQEALDTIANNQGEGQSPIAQREENAGLNQFGYSKKDRNSKKNNRIAGIFKSKKGIGIIAGILGGGGILTTLFGPASMLINLHENLIAGNDTASIVMERRLKKNLKNLTRDGNEELCKLGKNKLKCRMGSISNRSLRTLAKKGIRPIFEGSNEALDHKKIARTGYPEKNPIRYAIDTGSGTKYIDSKDLMGFLSNKENRHIASKVLGVRGAFNMRFRAWTGKHMRKFYSAIGFDRSGSFLKGLKDDLSKKAKDSSPAKKLQEARTKLSASLKEKFPGTEAVRAKVEANVDKHTKKFGRGGAAYALAATGCMALKMPKIVAASVAGIQLLQVMKPVSDIVLTSGSRLKATGFDNNFTAEEMDIVGSLLTEKTTNSSGKKTSALDSKYLLSALGVVKNKLPISKKFTPGYGVLTSPSLQTGVSIESATSGACNFILSPVAMYSAAVGNAILVGATGIVGFVGSWVLSEIGSFLVGKAVKYALPALEWLAQNDDIPSAKGEELGDVLGIGAAAFFSSGAMARHIPALTTGQAVAFDAIKQEEAELQKEMDIASLGQLNISSQYTFLGSLLHSIRAPLLASGAYSSPIQSIAQIPSIALSATLPFYKVGAATNISSSYCGYAKDFDLEGPDGKTPAINMAGLPCTGFSSAQDSMEVDEAIDLMVNEGWLNDEKEIRPESTIEDLLASGYIREGTPLEDYIRSCSDATSGDYLFNSAGCIIDETARTKSLLSLNQTVANSGKFCSQKTGEPEGNACFNGTLKEAENDPKPLNDSRSLAAIAVFLVDYQVAQSINGEDDEEDYASEIDDKKPDEDTSIVAVGAKYFNYKYLLGGGSSDSIESLGRLIRDVKNNSLEEGTKILDAAGFVRTSIYEAYGVDIGKGSSENYPSSSHLEEIEGKEVKPGDIAWKRDHVEIITDKQGGTVYTQGARGEGFISGPKATTGWIKYYRVRR